MEPFVLKTLKRLRKESPRRFKDLRVLCDELIVALSEKEKANGENNNVDSDADQYFEPLEAACETRQPRLMEIALDALHFLVEHGYLRGKRKISSNIFAVEDGENEPKINNNRTLMDAIIETVSKCSDEFDDGVQLQVIKTLLTSITSLHCEVHEASLLLSVRACFHINLISKNPVNKTTAKAALTQMLSVVNQRMELYEATNKATNIAEENDMGESKMSQSGVSEEKYIVSSASDDEGVGKQSSSEKAESSAPGIQTNQHDIDEKLPTIMENSNGNHIPGSGNVNQWTFPSIFHKDAYLLFRALCKLSMKGPLNEEAGAHSDHIALQNKVLSLELILHILQNSGPAFRNGEKFIYAIRNYLCVSLLSNCTSLVAQVTGLSLQIFVLLTKNFKEHLKSEMEIFVSTIFLRILESENSTYDHKYRVLEVFQTICKDPSAQVELFINYDCDLDAINLFSRIVDGFAKIAKNPLLSGVNRNAAVDFISSTGKKILLEEQNIRTMGLEGLVLIIRSLESSSGLLSTAGNSNSNIGSNKGKLDTNNESLPNDEESSSNALLEGSNSLPKIMNPSQDNSSENVVNVFDRKQKIQEEIDNGILKFNLNAKKGLAYLASLGHIEMTPKSVAEFFRQFQDRLDKTVVGDYLGREREYENGFCLKVLHEYVEAMDFEGIAFDLAIRRFLSGFRLPGEAQKIDRIMEKFAERYYIQNRGTFASADMAFILAFSTIMLQTNLHNPAIRDDKRMTKEQFIKQNKGISADGELPDDMLSEIYDRIAAAPISITEDDKLAKKLKKDEEKSSFVVFQTTTDRRKKDAFSHERKEMVRAGEAMIRQFSKRTSMVTSFRNASRSSDDIYVKPMFEVVWPPVIGVLSQILETYDDQQMIDLCLEGFKHSIFLACRLDIPIARNTFINALVKFTTLDTIREMKPKNVMCIKLLMSVALFEGDYLEESWLQVLQNISQLSRLFLLIGGSHANDVFINENSSQKRGAMASGSNHSVNNRGTSNFGSNDRQYYASTGSTANNTSAMDPFTKLFLGPSKAETARLIEEANAEFVSREIDPDFIDRIFLNSVNLSGESVRHFVKCLCEVSLLEITASSSMNSLRGKDSSFEASAPRIFGLQKLVEVADCNMLSRSRIDWSNIWALLAKHFSSVGLHDNQAITMYAIDSLKQLSIKFLQKEELSNFSFQRIFLKPFEIILQRSKTNETKDLILRCIQIMIQACSKNIQSGWRSIFAIFEIAAAQESFEISNLAFVITEELMNEFALLKSDFSGVLNCLVAFVAAHHTSLSLKALNYLSKCADHLATSTVNADTGGMTPGSSERGFVTELEEVDDKTKDQTGQVFGRWWPLLLGLSARVSDSRVQVRVKALNTLHTVLSNYGHLFSPQTWSVIFKGVLFPIIDSAKTDNTVQLQSLFPTQNPPQIDNNQSWIGTMGLNVLTVCLELYQKFREKDSVVPLLPDLLTMLEGCICQETESLAKMGLRVMNDLIMSLRSDAQGNGLEPYHADLICSRVTASMMKNICLNYGDNGCIRIDGRKRMPDVIRSVLTADCPILYRRRSKEPQLSTASTAHRLSSSDQRSPPPVLGSILTTPYGVGKLNEALPPKPYLDLPKRFKLSLSWGAELYAADLIEVNLLSNLSVPAIETAPQIVWNQQQANAAMTSMVISLDFIRVVSEIIQVHKLSWKYNHYEQFLLALEVLYWHAFCFNEDILLRFQLGEYHFMLVRNKRTPLPNQQIFVTSPTLPHLLDQEVRSMEQILSIIYRQYTEEQLTTIGNKSFFLPWIERISLLAIDNYLIFEELDGIEQHSMNAQQDKSEVMVTGSNKTFSMEKIKASLRLELFKKERHEGYRVSVTTILEGLLVFTYQQFTDNLEWIVPCLSRLIICSELSIRLLVRDIYKKFVNPRLIK